ASVAGNETDPNTANNSASSGAVTISSTADLTLLATATPDSVPLGSNFTFTVTVVNVGNQGATNVVITDTLPVGVTFVSVTPSGAFQCTATLPSTVTCPVGALAAGASVTATIVVTTAPPAVPGTFTNTATVTPTDATPADNTASAS